MSKAERTGYSKNYRHDGRSFRYNFDTMNIEYVYKDRDTKQWEVIDSIGLNVDSWLDNPRNWVADYSYEVEDNCRWMMQELKEEFGF